jgi:hypothetical protein
MAGFIILRPQMNGRNIGNNSMLQRCICMGNKGILKWNSVNTKPSISAKYHSVQLLTPIYI